MAFAFDFADRGSSVTAYWKIEFYRHLEHGVRSLQTPYGHCLF